MDKTARPIHLRPDPSNTGTKHLDAVRVELTAIVDAEVAARERVGATMN